MSSKVLFPSKPIWDELDPQLCEDGLDFLAYVLREDGAEGRVLDARELENIREVATELLMGVASWLGRSTLGLRAEQLGEVRALRFFEALRAALSPETSRAKLAEAFQSIADLLRASRRAAGGDRSSGAN